MCPWPTLLSTRSFCKSKAWQPFFACTFTTHLWLEYTPLTYPPAKVKRVISVSKHNFINYCEQKSTKRRLVYHQNDKNEPCVCRLHLFRAKSLNMIESLVAFLRELLHVIACHGQTPLMLGEHKRKRSKRSNRRGCCRSNQGAMTGGSELWSLYFRTKSGWQCRLCENCKHYSTGEQDGSMGNTLTRAVIRIEK